MNRLIKSLAATTLMATAALVAQADSVLRLDEVAVGELDPAKATDYADSMLMFNVYDTLLLPKGIIYLTEIRSETIGVETEM